MFCPGGGNEDDKNWMVFRLPHSVGSSSGSLGPLRSRVVSCSPRTILKCGSKARGELNEKAVVSTQSTGAKNLSSIEHTRRRERANFLCSVLVVGTRMTRIGWFFDCPILLEVQVAVWDP
eukprot:TRINITY_DN6750_c0_g1_i2.p3 TRINITY_DN6750_c0_g1~~TRINITY_DN6750_c0_g1_i2.p3  ORF type:complete len:120 (+),score=26.81 TRINITY_DN6750_c0_g1_i2:109-468(+)